VNDVFLDTVGLIAIWNKSDQWHAAARQTFADLRATGAAFVTTQYVLLECGNAAARTTIRNDVVDLQLSLTKEHRLIWPTEDDWDKAWEAYSRGEAASAGIVDHVSFIIMRRLGITRAFTNDTHFQAAGFETLF
jgi:predicted nucleic acid-binding protein